MLSITKINRDQYGNVELMNANGAILILANRNKSIFLDVNNSELVRIGDVITDGSYTPSASVALDPAQITEIGGVAFSGNAQDLINELRSYFFG